MYHERTGGCWLDWDQQAVVEDLSVIASLGLDHIRIQCLWPLFQPGITNVSERVLANLHALLDAAVGAGLDVEVTVLNGWMSGLSFMPAWVAPLKKPTELTAGNIFTDSEVIEAEKLLFRRIAEIICKHPRFLGFDIGNEMGVLMRWERPTGCGRHRASKVQAKDQHASLESRVCWNACGGQHVRDSRLRVACIYRQV